MTTRNELAEKMLKLAYDMQDVAVDLDYYGGLSEWSQKSQDLMAAASWVKVWGQEMLKEPVESRTDELMRKTLELARRELNNYKRI